MLTFPYDFRRLSAPPLISVDLPPLSAASKIAMVCSRTGRIPNYSFNGERSVETTRVKPDYALEFSERGLLLACMPPKVPPKELYWSYPPFCLALNLLSRMYAALHHVGSCVLLHTYEHLRLRNISDWKE